MQLCRKKVCVLQQEVYLQYFKNIFSFSDLFYQSLPCYDYTANPIKTLFQISTSNLSTIELSFPWIRYNLNYAQKIKIVLLIMFGSSFCLLQVYKNHTLIIFRILHHRCCQQPVRHIDEREYSVVCIHLHHFLLRTSITISSFNSQRQLNIAFYAELYQHSDSSGGLYQTDIVIRRLSRYSSVRSNLQSFLFHTNCSNL